MNAAYEGPRRIVVIGAGAAGLATADAIVAGLAHGGGTAEEIEIVVLEADAFPGGRAGSSPLEGSARDRHPFAPYGVSVPHGLHFVWGSYQHLAQLVESDARLTPAPGTSTYCAWMAPPDTPGGADAESRVVSVHVCNPADPDAAWHPAARRVLRAFAEDPGRAELVRRVSRDLIGGSIDLGDLLSYMDILFDEEHLGPELRWILLLTGGLSGLLGAPETSPLLRALLKGRDPSDVDIGELMQPLFDEDVVPRLLRLDARFNRSRLGLADREGRLSTSLGRVAAWVHRASCAGTSLPLVADSARDVAAVLDIVLLVARDAARLATRLPTYHPKRSGYFKNVLKAAFSSPFALDCATSLRDVQFGVRRYEGAVLSVFDGDDSRGAWQGILRRIQRRLDEGPVRGRIRMEAAARAIRLSPDGSRVTRVELGAPPARPDAPMTTPLLPAETTETLDADIVVSTVPPAVLAALLGEAEALHPAWLRGLRELGAAMNETINLQLFFPTRHELPFPPLPPGSRETPPFGISNLEGPFTIVVDLRRAFGRAAFEAIRLDDPAAPDAFDGTAWELVGAYADLFVHDPLAHRGRFQWPLDVQERLVALLHRPDDFEPATLDRRAWIHDSGAPGRLPPPPMGQVAADRREDYDRRWRTEATPLIVATTLRQLAALPGLAAVTSRYLEDQAGSLDRREPIDIKFTLVRNAAAENRFFSAELGLFQHRPHARFESPVRGLWVAGDWTRNGLNLQAMEGAVISGLQAAYGVLEQIRGGGLRDVRFPRIDPGIVPDGAWDVGPE